MRWTGRRGELHRLTMATGSLIAATTAIVMVGRMLGVSDPAPKRRKAPVLDGRAPPRQFEGERSGRADYGSILPGYVHTIGGQHALQGMQMIVDRLATEIMPDGSNPGAKLVNG
jgi:hypothetical protein